MQNLKGDQQKVLPTTPAESMFPRGQGGIKTPAHVMGFSSGRSSGPGHLQNRSELVPISSLLASTTELSRSASRRALDRFPLFFFFKEKKEIKEQRSTRRVLVSRLNNSYTDNNDNPSVNCINVRVEDDDVNDDSAED